MTSGGGYLVVANERAGQLDGGDALHGVLAVLAAAGPTEVAWVSGGEGLDEALRRLDGRTLVVAGGDGSLNRAVNHLLRLWGAGPSPGGDGWRPGRGPLPAVGVLPLGTGNDICRGLGLPLDAVAAAEAVVAGRARPAAVLATSLGLVALNAVHVGLGARAADRAAALKRWAGPLAYALGGLLEGALRGGERVRAWVDGDEVVAGEEVLLFAVSNGRSVGGGTPLAPDADLTEPVGQVRIVRRLSRPARAGLSVALLRGRGDDHPAVERLEGCRAGIEAVAGDLPVNLDGELLRAPGLEVVVRPGAWRVIVPRGR